MRLRIIVDYIAKSQQLISRQIDIQGERHIRLLRRGVTKVIYIVPVEGRIVCKAIVCIDFDGFFPGSQILLRQQQLLGNNVLFRGGLQMLQKQAVQICLADIKLFCYIADGYGAMYIFIYVIHCLPDQRIRDVHIFVAGILRSQKDIAKDFLAAMQDQRADQTFVKMLQIVIYLSEKIEDPVVPVKIHHIDVLRQPIANITA